MPDLLTPEEKDALAQSFSAAVGGTEPAITLAVFPSVTQLRPDETKVLHTQLEAWAEHVAADLGRQLQSQCTADFARIQTQPFSGLERDGELAFWGVLDGDPRHGFLLTIPEDFGTSICERSFGGPLQPIAAHPLSRSETRLLQQLAREWLTVLPDAWRGHSVQPHTRANEGAVADPEEALGWIRFTVELRCGAVNGSLSLCMAPSTVRRTQQAGPSQAAVAVSAAEIVTRLGTVPLELSGILGRASFSVDELANLRVGDVIFLDQKADALVEVQVCSRPRFRARVGLNGQTVALELVEPFGDKN